MAIVGSIVRSIEEMKQKLSMTGNARCGEMTTHTTLTTNYSAVWQRIGVGTPIMRQVYGATLWM